MTILFQEDWTGTDGDAWNATRWPTIEVTSGTVTSFVNILSNQGHLNSRGCWVLPRTMPLEFR